MSIYKLFNSLTLSKQISYIFISVPIVMSVVLLVYFSNLTIDNKNKQKEIIAKGIANSVIEKIDRNYYERFGDVQAFAVNKLSVETAKTYITSEDQQFFLNTMMKYYVLYDLMLIINKEGNVIATNTVDKLDNKIMGENNWGVNYSNEEWFRICMSQKGPEGGAWYSDLIMNKDVIKIYKSNGLGMEFTAPIKNKEGVAIGVWYNFASWKDITQQIRKESEAGLNVEYDGSFIVITDKNGLVIDGDDENLILKNKIDASTIKRAVTFKINSNIINPNDYITAVANSKGAYIYKGKQWKSIVFIPKQTFNFLIFVSESWIGILIILVLLALAILIAFKYSFHLEDRISKISNGVKKLSLGQIQSLDVADGNDEISTMAVSVNGLTNRMKLTAEFAEKIAEGTFDETFKPVSEFDILGQSLINMNQSLKKSRLEEQNRNWAADGLATLSDILRENNQNLDELCDKLLKQIISYVKSNQGAIYILNDNDAKNSFLELKACYAWDKKRYLNKRFEIGQGLIGDTYLEGEVIHLTEIPKNFLEITSGLGLAQPNCIIILPLKTDKETVGILELATFGNYQQHVIQYLDKISNIIALTIESTKINIRTKVLLEESQSMTEQMRAQEEEMRQNMEEMQATQEEIGRKETEFINEINKLKKQVAELEA